MAALREEVGLPEDMMEEFGKPEGFFECAKGSLISRQSGCKNKLRSREHSSRYMLQQEKLWLETKQEPVLCH